MLFSHPIIIAKSMGLNSAGRARMRHSKKNTAKGRAAARQNRRLRAGKVK